MISTTETQKLRDNRQEITSTKYYYTQIELQENIVVVDLRQLLIIKQIYQEKENNNKTQIPKMTK